VIYTQFMMLGYRLAYQIYELIPVRISIVAIEFSRDYQSFSAAELN